MVGVVIGRRAAAGAGFRATVLGIAVLAPRARSIRMRTVVRGAVSAGAAGCRSAVLTGGIVAPAPVAQAVRSIVIAGCTAISAIAFPAMLAAGIFFPRAVAITMAAGIDRLRFRLAASARIASVPVAGASCVLYILENPCMTAAVRAGTGTVTTSAVTLIGVSAKVLDVVAEITLIIVCMAARRMCDFNVCALERILSA